MSESACTAREPIVFRGRTLRAPKGFLDGTHRRVAPEVTLERIRPLFAAAGLTRLADITGLDRIGIPVVVGIRPNAASIVCSAGKGFTRVAAQVSAAMEAIELHHAEVARLPGFVDAYDDVSRRHAVAPLDRLTLLRPSLFSPRRPERWTLGWDIVGQHEVAVPLVQVLVHGFGYDPVEHRAFAPLGSNGLASGNDLLEAVCAGLYEVIERDALTCTAVAARRGAGRFRRVPLDAVGPLVAELCQRLDAAGFDLVLLDRTVDTRVPVYHATIYDRSAFSAGAGGGYGAHLDPQIAMLRAITEAVQSRAVLIAGARDDIFRHRREEIGRFDDAERFRVANETLPIARPASPTQATESFEGDVGCLLDRLRHIGCNQVVVFELTAPDCPISVVRVIVPGLEGYMSEYYTPGARALAYSMAEEIVS